MTAWTVVRGADSLDYLRMREGISRSSLTHIGLDKYWSKEITLRTIPLLAKLSANTTSFTHVTPMHLLHPGHSPRSRYRLALPRWYAATTQSTTLSGSRPASAPATQTSERRTEKLTQVIRVPSRPPSQGRTSIHRSPNPNQPRAPSQ